MELAAPAGEVVHTQISSLVRLELPGVAYTHTAKNEGKTHLQ